MSVDNVSLTKSTFKEAIDTLGACETFARIQDPATIGRDLLITKIKAVSEKMILAVSEMVAT